MFRGHVTESTGLEDPGPNPFWRRRIPGEHSKFVQARPTVTIWVFGGDLFRTSCLGKRSPISVSEFCVSQSVQSGEGRRIVSSWGNEASWNERWAPAETPGDPLGAVLRSFLDRSWEHLLLGETLADHFLRV